MHVLRILFILTLSIIVISCSQVSTPKFVTDGIYTSESYQAISDSLTTDADLINLCKEFMDNAEDIDLLRNTQSSWKELDQNGVLAYSKELSESNTSSAIHQYLYGRVVENNIEKINLGRKAIELDSNFPYGYRLVLATYDQNVLNGDKSDEGYEQLSKMLDEDKAFYTKLAEIDGEKYYSHKFLYDYQVFTGDYEGAMSTLEKAKPLEQRWPSPFETAVVFAGLEKYDDSKNAVKDYLTGQVGDDELDDYIGQYYTRALFSAKQYDEIIRSKKAIKGYKKNKNVLYDLACVYSLKGDTENAMAHLTNAANNGWDGVAHTKRDSDLNSIHDNANWDKTIATIQANWDNGKDKRREEILSSKINEDAPSWNLEDINGKMVSLESQKGKIIILDFWATWCGPCKMAMPVLDDFVKNRAPENVEVFSINVWEKGRSKPVKFMEENNYAMTLLYGVEGIEKDYGFDGIPFLCVIDKDGKIRFKHSGYSEGLNEALDFWIEDLL